MSGFHDPEREADALLLSQVAAAEPTALARFYDRFAPTLFSLVSRIIRDAKLAEQVFQETFAQVPRLATTFDPTRSSALAWVVMLFRESALQRARPLPATEPPLPTAGDRRPEDLAILPGEVRGRHAQIRSVLAQFTAEQRQALELSFFSGLSHEQIAERLGTPLDAVKMRIRRGLMRLRESLKEVA